MLLGEILWALKHSFPGLALGAGVFHRNPVKSMEMSLDVTHATSTWKGLVDFIWLGGLVALEPTSELLTFYLCLATEQAPVCVHGFLQPSSLVPNLPFLSPTASFCFRCWKMTCLYFKAGLKRVERIILQVEHLNWVINWQAKKHIPKSSCV